MRRWYLLAVDPFHLTSHTSRCLFFVLPPPLVLSSFRLCLYLNVLLKSSSVPPKRRLKVRHPAIIAPIPLPTPPQRLILRPSHLARLGIRIALELWRRATKQALIERRSLVYLNRIRRTRRSRRSRRGSGCCVARSFGRGRSLRRSYFLEGGRYGGCALEAFEFGLLGGGEFGGGWA